MGAHLAVSSWCYTALQWDECILTAGCSLKPKPPAVTAVTTAQNYICMSVDPMFLCILRIGTSALWFPSRTANTLHSQLKLRSKNCFRNLYLEHIRPKQLLENREGCRSTGVRRHAVQQFHHAFSLHRRPLLDGRPTSNPAVLLLNSWCAAFSDEWCQFTEAFRRDLC